MTTTLHTLVPASWQAHLRAVLGTPLLDELQRFLDEESVAHAIFPPRDRILEALRLTPYDRVRVVILGQDPYHDDGQAHGLAFSVLPGVRPPPSLRNIFKELRDDLGCRVPNNGYLVPWAEQGVLLLNTVLTVRAHSPASHKGTSWATFTDAIIHKVGQKPDRVVFVLWGAHAQKK